LHDLFTLGSAVHKRTETSDIFAGLDTEIKPEDVRRKQDVDDEKKSTKKNERDDAFILRSLFENKGLKGALKHDVIVDQTSPEYVIVEHEGLLLPLKFSFMIGDN
jgi:hypothetical protein